MRVLVITNSYGADGAAAMLRNFARHAIKSLGWSIDAVATRPPEAMAREMIDSSGMNLIGNSVNLGNYECILINTLVDLAVVDQIQSRVPIVVWAHEGETVLFNSKWPAIEWIRRFSKTRLVIFQTVWQTESVFRSYLYKLSPDRIKVIPNGIKRIEHLGRGERPLKEPFRLVSIGLTPRKRPMDLLQASINLNLRYSMRCEIIGGLEHFHLLGPEAEKIANDNPGVIKWAGELHGIDLHRKLLDSDIYCHPSGDESFGLSPLEAAQLDLPVILADLECYDYVGWKDEVNCLKYPIGQISNLEQQIDRLLNDKKLYSRLSKQGKELAEGLSWQKFVSDMSGAIESACRQ